MTGKLTIQLLCRAGSRLHAVSIENVIEVMRVLPVEPLAGAPSYVRGLCVMRGTPVPVVDAGLLTGDRAAQSGRLVAVKAGKRVVALQVDAVLGIKAFDAGTFDALPPLLRDAATDTVAAVGTLDAELMVTLHAARMVPDSVFDDIGARP